MMQVGLYGPGLSREKLAAPDFCQKKILSKLVAYPDVDPVLIGHSTRPDHCPDSVKYKKISRIPIQAEHQLNKSDIDIIHYHYFYNTTIPWLVTKKTLLTYHGDLQWVFPQHSPSSIFSPYLQRLFEVSKIKAYDKVVFVSNDLKERVKRRYSPFSLDAETVYNGVDLEDYSPKVSNKGLFGKYEMQSPYLLHVSNLAPKKNPEVILKSFKEVRSTHDINLIIGGGGWNNDRKVGEIIEDYGLTDSVFLVGFIPEDDLPAFYAHATAFLFPSLHETFGLPILEAMACGTPVITANKYAMPEITADAAIHCNPSSTVEVADAVKKVLDQPELNERLAKRGRDRAREFSWEKSAQSYREVYDEILDGDNKN